jgi:hypothetical protein
VAQSFDIPPKVRVSLYVVSDEIDYDFEAAVFDNKMVKSIADGPFDKRVRAQLMEAKLTGRFGFELVEATQFLKPLTSFLQYLDVGEDVEQTILEARHIVEVTAVEPLSEAMSALKFVHFAAAFLARELEGVVVEPYSLKVYREDDEALDKMQIIEAGTPSLKPFLTVVQSHDEGQKVRTTTHGLSRFGLPDFAVSDTEPALAGPLSYLMRGLAQSFFENVLKAKNEGLDRYSFAKPLNLSFEQLQKGNLGDLPASNQRASDQKVPLKLSRSLSEASIGFAFRGRRKEKNASLQALLAGLGLGFD